MASHGSGGGADPVDDALQQLGEGLARLQDARRAECRAAEGRMLEALRRQEQGTERAEGEAVSPLEQELQEDDDAIRAQQRQLPETKERATGADEVASEGPSGEGTEQSLDERVKMVEGSLQTSMAGCAPSVPLHLLEQPISRDASRSSSASAVSSISFSISPSPSSESGAPETGDAAAGGAGTSPAEALLGPAPSSASSGAGRQGATADGQQRDRERVERLARDVEVKMNRARILSFPLEEKLCKEAEFGEAVNVQRLINSGADVNYTGKDGRTALHRAVSVGWQWDIVLMLLQRRADVHAVTPAGTTALHMAATSDSNGRILRLLIDEGADVNARDINGEAPLHGAALENNVVAVYMLLKAGARKDLKAWGGTWENKTPYDLCSSPDIKSHLRP